MTPARAGHDDVTHEDRDTRLTLSAQGAVVLSLETAGMPILRAARVDARADPAASALFPMVPWCNRVSAGRVEGSAARPVLLPNWPTTPFPVHGFGWLDLWRVDSRTAESVRLVHVRHDPEAYSYRAVLDITLLPDGAEFRLACTNMGNTSLPFGIGLHTYLPRATDSILTISGGTRVVFDARGLPADERAVEGDDDFRSGRTLPETSFSVLYPDCTAAEVAGPQSTLRLEAGGAFRNLLVWAPEGRDFVCVEPMSHRVDDFSARASAAPHDIAPGATTSGFMILRVQ